MKTMTFYRTCPLWIVVLLLFATLPLIMLAPPTEGTVEVHYADKTFAAHQSVVNCVAWAPNSTEVVSGGDDSKARLWKWNTTRERTTYESHTNNVNAVDWSPDGLEIVSADSDGNVKIWNARTGGAAGGFDHNNDEDIVVRGVAWHPSQHRVVTCGDDDVARVRNVDSPIDPAAIIATFSGHTDNVNSVEYSPNGNLVASGSNDNKIKVWDPLDGQELRTFTGHYMTVNSVAWSLDGTKIVSGSDDHTARIWDASTGSELFQFTGPSDSVLTVDWSPDGTKIVSGSADETIKIWDAETGYIYVNFTGHNGPVRCVEWSRDGDKIAAASTDTRATIWVLIAPPSTPKLYFPDDEVLRGDTITIQGEAEAYFTPTEDLAADFEYKYHSDAEWTSEGLTSPVFEDGKWQVDFTPEESWPIGSYGFRVRFQEVNELYSVWTEKAGAVTVLNNAPSAQISAVPFNVFRVQQASVAVTVSDLESNPEEMSVTSQYSEAAAESWESDVFSSPYYNFSRKFWICNFTFSTRHGLTDYKIRVRAEDPDGGYSSWSVVESSIRLLNNPPRVTNISFSPSYVYRGGSVKIWIDVEDPEDASMILVPEVEIKGPTSVWIPIPVINNPSGSNFTAFYNTTAGNELGYYNLRIYLEDIDGGEGLYYYNRSLTVMNNLPEVTGEYIEIGLYNDRIDLFYLTPFAMDYEDGMEDLIWEIVESSSPQFSAVMSDSTTLSVEPSLDGGTGKGLLIKFKITDRDGGVSYKDIYVEVRDASECPNIGVFLRSPAKGIIIGETIVNLNWEINYTLGAPIYRVYMGESEDNMLLVHTSEMVNSFTYSNLYDGIEYYWKVTARLHAIPRTFESPVWQFTVNTGYVAKHDINMSFDLTIFEDVNPGDEILFTLTISNNGNEPEEVRLEVWGRLRGFIEMEINGETVENVEEIKVNIEAGEDVRIPMSLTWRKTWGSSDIKLSLTGKYADKNLTKYVEFKGKGTPSGKEPEGSISPMVWIILIIIILGGLAGAYFVWRLKSRKDLGGDHLEPSPFVMPPPPPIPEGPATVSLRGPPGSPPPGARPPRFISGKKEEAPRRPTGMDADEIQAEIVKTIELLKTLESHKTSLEDNLIWIEEPVEKQVIKSKIVAIVHQQNELQQQAVILGEKAKRLVKAKEDEVLDEIFGKTTENRAEEGPIGVEEEVKALPAKTIPLSEVKALPEGKVPGKVEEEPAGEAKVETEPAAVSIEVEAEISPEERSKIELETLLNEIRGFIDEAKEIELDVTTFEEAIVSARGLIDEEKVEEAMKLANSTKKELEEVVNKGLQEMLLGKIKKLSSDINAAKEKKIGVADEADALNVINKLTEREKYREAISTLRGIQSSIDEKLVQYEKVIRKEIIAEAKIELEGLELEAVTNLDEFRSYIETVIESVDIGDFETADENLRKFEEAKIEARSAEVAIPAPLPTVTPSGVPAEAPATDTPTIAPPKPAVPPKKRVLRRVKKRTKRVVKRKVKRK